MDLHTWIAQQVDAIEALAREAATSPLAYADDDPHSPDAMLRRCEADRRILARHRIATEWTWQRDPACHGCGTDGDCDDPVTDNVNDCPELLDLAHALGITEQTLAGLDRPQPPERKPTTGPRLTHWLTPPITTSDVPAALRGPRWKP